MHAWDTAFSVAASITVRLAHSCLNRNKADFLPDWVMAEFTGTPPWRSYKVTSNSTQDWTREKGASNSGRLGSAYIA